MADQQPYKNLFTSWADVQREFETDAPEPAEVLHASYEYECYSGEALVVYRNGDSYFLVEGSHCSCYGLEGQFKPEEYDRDTLVEAMKRSWMSQSSAVLVALGEVLQ